MSPLVRWTGWDARSAPDGPDATQAFTRAAPAVGPDAHYELLAVAGRGFRPPRFLGTDHLGDGAHLDDGVEQVPDQAGLRQTWSLVYRRIAETGPPETAPFAIYLLGVDPPEDATDDQLAEFNEFYTGVHLVEVAERRRALRALRYELVRAVRPPSRRAPRFLAVYEVDETSAANRRHVGPPYSSGPDVWQRHTTPWRLWYRRLVPGDVGTESAGPS